MIMSLGTNLMWSVLFCTISDYLFSLPVKRVLLDTNDDARLIFCYMKMPSIKVVGIYKICVILVLYVYKGY